MPTKAKQSLLWKIEGDALPNASYIFGTMHVKDQRAFQRLDKVYDAISACNIFAAEFDLDSSVGIDPHLFNLPSGLTLNQIMPIKKYEKLRKTLQRHLKIDIHPLRHNQPLLVSNLIEAQLLTTDMPHSLDEHLWQYARSLTKEMSGIETLQEQISVLQKISSEQQLQNLLATVRNFPRYRQHLLQMANWYAQGELLKLYRSTKKNTRAMRSILLYDRNKLMAARITTMTTQQTAFCAIGAAHLAGEKGVLRLLKQRGFRLNPM